MAEEVTAQDRLLLERITRALKSDSQYEQYFDAHDSKGIEKVRALGRRAARDLGWKVRTFATDPGKRQDCMVRVVVAVTQSSPLHEELMRVRGAKALRRVFADLNFGSGHNDG
jgi:hypothetical protein